MAVPPGTLSYCEAMMTAGGTRPAAVSTQPVEFGVSSGQQELAATAIALNDVHSLGLTGRFDRMTAPVCPIAGVGPGMGSALAKHVSEGGYRVALLARSEERLATLEKQLSNANGYLCDVSDPAQIEAVASAVEQDIGNPSVVIHNAVGEVFGTFREIDPSSSPTRSPTRSGIWFTGDRCAYWLEYVDWAASESLHSYSTVSGDDVYVPLASR
jgi:hypothetical protein